jgi:protein-S-isoprenylcysteine O-methyltransferase Ste14
MPVPEHVARKTVGGFAFLILMLGILLFGPAGTFDYWQAWLYLCIFIVSTGLITAYLWKNDPRLLERRVNAGARDEKEPSQKLIQRLATPAFIAIMIFPGLDRRFGWSEVPVAGVIAGDVSVALGLLIVFIVFRENTFAAGTIEVAADQRVVSTGPYAIVRHPMYVGALVMLYGTPLALGSSWGLLAVVPITLIIIWRLLDEEQFLAKNLPGYDEYRRRVRYRLLPFIW